MLRIIPSQPIQSRRENMYRQMTLWPEPEAPETKTEIWRKLDPNTQKMLIITLSRVIQKAICPKTLVDNQEVNHEHE
jgi:hypothetical protein